MILQFSDDAWEDCLYCQQVDKNLLKRINELIKTIQRDPFQCIGKPETLRHALAGYWSRRINDEHRIVYKIDGDVLMIALAHYQY